MELISKIIAIALFIIVVAAVLLPVTNQLRTDDVETIDIILIDGQSNGAYYPNNQIRCNPAIVNQNIGTPEHKAYYYGTADGSSRVVGENTEIREMYVNGQWVIGGEEPGLAYNLMKKNNRDVLVLNIARGGTGIKDLAVGSIWDASKNMIETAVSEISTMYAAKNYVGWVMIHGEHDANNSVSYYEQYFNVLDGKLANLGFKECYIALPRYEQSYNAYIAMEDLANKEPDVHIATSITETFTVQNGLLYTDDVHYTQKGRLVLAEAVIDHIPADPNFGDKDMSNLIQVIPIIMFVAAILMAVRLMRKQDA